jgi:hypothetical protein
MRVPIFAKQNSRPTHTELLMVISNVLTINTHGIITFSADQRFMDDLW